MQVAAIWYFESQGQPSSPFFLSLDLPQDLGIQTAIEQALLKHAAAKLKDCGINYTPVVVNWDSDYGDVEVVAGPLRLIVSFPEGVVAHEPD